MIERELKFVIGSEQYEAFCDRFSNNPSIYIDYYFDTNSLAYYASGWSARVRMKNSEKVTIDVKTKRGVDDSAFEVCGVLRHDDLLNAVENGFEIFEDSGYLHQCTLSQSRSKVEIDGVEVSLDSVGFSKHNELSDCDTFYCIEFEAKRDGADIYAVARQFFEEIPEREMRNKYVMVMEMLGVDRPEPTKYSGEVGYGTHVGITPLGRFVSKNMKLTPEEQKLIDEL